MEETWTVGKLIEELSKYDKDASVIVTGAYAASGSIESVELDTYEESKDVLIHTDIMTG